MRERPEVAMWPKGRRRGIIRNNCLKSKFPGSEWKAEVADDGASQVVEYDPMRASQQSGSVLGSLASPQQGIASDSAYTQ